MDLNADSRTLPTHTIVEGQKGEEELSLSSTYCERESEGTILLQLLEFKTLLLEAVEELHIRRDAETRFEDQLSKLLLEKQELEWEKESLQQQIETVAKQNKESLSNVEKQFQAKMRNTEEEKWKYQLSAELKDKEINNLKEEMKSLQLLKYNLEKNSSELEQKLALQSRSKDSHLNQLGKVEKRFTALSRQCTMIKQAHVKLEENVNEAMSINRKLASSNEKQEATITSLKKELEEVSKQLIKARITSVTHDKIHRSTIKEHHIQQLQQKLNTETEINKKLCKENESVRAEKQEVVKALQHAQHLVLSQTQTVSRVEQELQTQEEQYQALKQEHEMMREKSKALEDKVAQLMESYAASKTSWDKEKTVFLSCIKKEQQDLQAVKEAYNALYQKDTKLSSLLKAQTRDSSQALCVSTQVFPSLVEKSLNEPMPMSEPCVIGSLQHAGAVTELVTTGATGEENARNHGQQSQYKQPLNHSNLFVSPPITKNLFSLGSHSGTGTCTSTLNEFTCNSRRSDPVAVSDLSFSSSFVSDFNLHIFQSTTESNQDHRTVYGSVDLVSSDKCENVEMNEKITTGEDDREEEKSSSKEDRNTKQQWNREKLLRGDVNAREMTKTADRADRQEDNKGSAEDAGDTKNYETETTDRVEGEAIDGVEEREKTAAHTSETPETQIQDQTTADTTITKSNQQQVIDIMDTESTQTVSEVSCSQSISLKVTDTDFSHANKERGNLRDKQLLPNFNSVDGQRVNTWSSRVIREEKNLCCPEVETQDANSYQSPNVICQVPEKVTAEVKLRKESAADFTTELSETVNESSIRCTQRDAAPLVTKTDVTVSIQEIENNTAPTLPMDSSVMKCNIKPTHDMCERNVTEEGSSVRTPVKSQSLSISGQETGQRESLVTDDDANSSTYRKDEENCFCRSVQDPMSFNLENTLADCVMNTVELDSEAESSSFQDHLMNVKMEDPKDAQSTESEVESKLHGNNEPTEAGCSDCYEQPPAKQMFRDNTNESFLQSSETYSSSFNWSNAQRKAAKSRVQSNVSTLQPFSEGAELNATWSNGNLRHPFSTIPMFLKSKHKKVPLVITRASELLNGSSVSGTAVSSNKYPQGEWKAMGGTCRDTTAADTESRTSLSITSFPSFASSSTVSKLSYQATPGSTKGSEFDQEPSCSQEIEDQQSSFRAQISKIEQFLNKERLSLPKRQKNDN